VTPVCHGPAFDFGGGGPDVNEAIQWMIDKVRGASGPGGPALDVAVLRCSGGEGYNAPVLALNGVNSVETILGTGEADFEDPAVAQAVARAEVVFFAGGNQANYIRFIRGTATDRAVRTVVARGGGLGGTSAGAAIQGAVIHDALAGSATGRQALADPYDRRIHFTEGWFGSLHLGNTLFETHTQLGGGGYDRIGRLLAFLARVVQDRRTPMLGIGLSAGASLVVDASGLAKVLGANPVYLVHLDRPPEACRPGLPLTCRRFRILRLLPGQTYDLVRRPLDGFGAAGVASGVPEGDYY